MLPYLARGLREPVVRARLGSRRARGPRRGPRAGGRAPSARTPARSSSPAAGPRRSTSRSRAPRGPARRAAHRIVTSPVEHHAVGHTLRHLEKFGFEVVELPVDRYGRVDPDERRARRSRTARSSCRVHARQQRGGHDPARSRRSPGACAARRGVLFHVDAVQAAPVAAPRRRRRWARTSSSLAAHKVEGPKGIGRALDPAAGRTSWPSSTAARRSATGGPARRTSRAPWAWPRAFELAAAERADDGRRACGRSATACATAVLAVDGVELTGHPVERLPHLLSVVVRGRRGRRRRPGPGPGGDRLLHRLRVRERLDASVSHVLTAMGYPDDEARGALRLSLGRTTTDAEIDEAARDRPARSLAHGSDRPPVAADPLPARPSRRMSRILVAMSGGVDSSVAAALLHEQGHEVVGVWMRLHDVADSYSEFSKSCCSRGCGRRCPARRRPAGHPVLRDEPGARVRGRRHRAVRRRLPRRPHAQPVRRLQHASSSSARCWDAPGSSTAARPSRPATTPAAAWSTRRTARGPCSPGPPTRPRTRPTSCTGCGRTSCAHSRFPLGDLTKPEVREIARGLGLVTADKPESQEICFVPGGDYRAELRSAAAGTPEPGPGARRRRARGRRARRARPASPWASARASAWRWASRATCRGIDPATNAIVARPARGPRDARRSRSRP